MVRGGRVVNVWVVDARIVIAVCARETDEFVVRRFAGLSAPNAELGAGRVEFCHAALSCEMESDDFVSYEVVARGEVGGDNDGINTAVD
jgi:hypothetical protein